MFIQNFLCSQLRYLYLRIDKVMLIRSVLFNFQGASSVTRSGDLFIISHLFELVKYFLKLFLNFLFKSLKKWLPFRKAHLLYHISFRLSRGISKNFEIFRDFLSFRLCYRSFPDSLYIIAPFFGFVNLFYTFSRILSHLHIILNNLSTAHSIMHNSPRQISTFSQTTDSFLLNITHFSAEYYFFSRFYDIVIV